MDVWDWKTGNFTGITDSENRAKAYVESHIQPGTTAFVMKVNSALGSSTPLGARWTATRTDAGIEWQFSRWAS
ncbi:MAG TPA: hypothetical protein VHZ03_56335 [Trebonia sp.]|jgi:hypothetical protein|nr:hypothetical protein [Trebonia sp.]